MWSGFVRADDGRLSLKILTVIGARPQFIKASAVSRSVRGDYAGQVEEVIVHTGQHHDANMSEVFFQDLEIPVPSYSLGVSGGLHGEMTGRMMAAIETVLLEEKPDWLLIYGDTNSTLAGTLAAVKLHIPVAHVEAGLRSFNMRMPEEVNRIVSDRLASALFCPTETAVSNLQSEGIRDRVWNVGDVMYDVSLFVADRAQKASSVLHDLDLEPRGYVLATCHRAENTDDRSRLTGVLTALGEIARDQPVVLPLHPRTKKQVSEFGLAGLLQGITVTEPLSFFDMVALEVSAACIATDSGGVQKEAFFYQVPCVTMRDETEWVETVESGWNQVVGADSERIVAAIRQPGSRSGTQPQPYGDGRASGRILELLLQQHAG